MPSRSKEAACPEGRGTVEVLEVWLCQALSTHSMPQWLYLLRSLSSHIAHVYKTTQ